MFKTLLCKGMFCANYVKFIFIASVVIVNISNNNIIIIYFRREGTTYILSIVRTK